VEILFYLYYVEEYLIIFSFDDKNIKKCKPYDKNKLQLLADEYSYDSNILFVSDVMSLLHKLFIDDYIVRNSEPNASTHF
jgi:hypothetical protein